MTATMASARARLCKITSDVPPASSLTYHASSGDTKITLKQDFLSFLMSIWKSTHLAHVLGHSFRIGGAMELLLAGVAPEFVAARPMSAQVTSI